MSPSKRILILGSTGFIGTAIAGAFVRTEWSVTGVSRHARQEKLDYDHRVMDLTEAGSLESLLADREYAAIVHAAGVRSDFVSQWKTGPELVQRLLGLSTQHSVTLLLIGSSGEYAPAGTDPVTESNSIEPLTRYASIKAAEIALATADHDADVRVLRAFNPIGRNMAPTLAPAAFARTVARILLGRDKPVVRVGDLSPVRDFFSVTDVGTAAVSIIKHGRRGRVYNCCSGTGRTVQELLDSIIAHADVQATSERLPTLLRPAEIPVQIGDAGLLKAETGWRATRDWPSTIDDLWQDWIERVRIER